MAVSKYIRREEERLLPEDHQAPVVWLLIALSILLPFLKAPQQSKGCSNQMWFWLYTAVKLCGVKIIYCAEMIIGSFLLLGYLTRVYSRQAEVFTNSSGCDVTYGTCTVNSVAGQCVSQSAGCCQGILSTGYWYDSLTILLLSFFFLFLCSPGSNDIQCCTATDGMFGVDIADPATVSDLNCFVSSGYKDFIVPRGFRSTGAVDTNVCPNLKNAKTAGIKFRDVYMFPCPVSQPLCVSPPLSPSLCLSPP
jgi:hypothetical protein